MPNRDKNLCETKIKNKESKVPFRGFRGKNQD
jgi:hypothetical protein